jgi:hypothetical protein
MCGNGDFRQPSCAGFAFSLALYGALSVGAIITIASFVAFVSARRFPPLLNVSSVLYTIASAILVIPVWAAGNKLGGAVVVLMALPASLFLLTAAFICFTLWIGHATYRRDPS